MDRYELQLPAQSFKHVFFLCDEFFVAVRNADVVQKLIYTWIGFFKVFGANEETGEGDKTDHVLLGLALEVG